MSFTIPRFFEIAILFFAQNPPPLATDYFVGIVATFSPQKSSALFGFADF